MESSSLSRGVDPRAGRHRHGPMEEDRCGCSPRRDALGVRRIGGVSDARRAPVEDLFDRDEAELVATACEFTSPAGARTLWPRRSAASPTDRSHRHQRATSCACHHCSMAEPSSTPNWARRVRPAYGRALAAFARSRETSSSPSSSAARPNKTAQLRHRSWWPQSTSTRSCGAPAFHRPPPLVWPSPSDGLRRSAPSSRNHEPGPLRPLSDPTAPPATPPETAPRSRRGTATILDLSRGGRPRPRGSAPWTGTAGPRSATSPRRLSRSDPHSDRTPHFAPHRARGAART